MNKDIPVEIIDLVRFLAKALCEAETFVYENCDGESLCKFPFIQGTRNQMDLKEIGSYPISNENLRRAMRWLIVNE